MPSLVQILKPVTVKAPTTNTTLKMGPMPERDMSKYAVLKPETVKFLPRDEFITKACGTLPTIEADVARYVVNKGHRAHSDLSAVETDNLYYAASYYLELQRRGGRLPKFTRWITSLYPGNEAYVKAFAKIGQTLTATSLVISNELVDILRAANSPHFASCFKDHPEKPLIRIAQEAVGIGVLYQDGPDGNMLCRAWIVHVKDPDGKDGLGIGRFYGAAPDQRALAKLISEVNGDIPVYEMNSYASGNVVSVTPINCFKTQLYFDFNVWSKCNAIKLAG